VCACRYDSYSSTLVQFTTCTPSPCHLHLHICSKVYFAFQPSSHSARAVLAYMETMSPLRRSCISKGTTVFVTASKVRSSWRTDTPCPVPRLYVWNENTYTLSLCDIWAAIPAHAGPAQRHKPDCQHLQPVWDQQCMEWTLRSPLGTPG